MLKKLDVPDELDGYVWAMDCPKGAMPAHRHNELEFNLVVSGSARYLLRTRRYDIRRGTLLWLFPGQTHVLMDPSADFQMWIAVFRPAFLTRTCNELSGTDILCESNPPGSFSRVLGEDDLKYILACCSEQDLNLQEPNMYNQGLAWLLRAAWRKWNATEIESNFDQVHPAVERAATLLHADPSLALPTLSRQAGLSPSRLSRVFHQDLGVTVSGFRNQCRIEHYLKLYGAGKRRTMLDCALEAGFGSYEQFHRVFKRYLGTTPREYTSSKNKLA